MTDFLDRMLAQTFMLALQMSAPLVVAMFLADVGLGFLARTAPQYNVFVIGIPIKILVGFLMLSILMPTLVTLYEHIFDEMFSAIQKLMLDSCRVQHLEWRAADDEECYRWTLDLQLFCPGKDGACDTRKTARSAQERAGREEPGIARPHSFSCSFSSAS